MFNMTSADCMNTNCDVVLALPHILLSLSVFYQRVQAKYLSAATLRNTIQCIFVVPVFMTSQSLPVKLMELNCKIYFWMEKGKRRTTTESKGRNNKNKDSTEYDTNSITWQCIVHTRGRTTIERTGELATMGQRLLQRPESVSLLKFI